MHTSHLARTLAWASWLLVASAGCGGASFEPASKIQGLRVLALQKQPPYAKPGETVDFKLLYWDGKSTEASPRNLEFNFFSCSNPPGDLYYACQKPSVIGSATRSGNLVATGGSPSGENDGAFDADAATLVDAESPGSVDGSDAKFAGEDATPLDAGTMPNVDGGPPPSGVEPIVTGSVPIGSDIVRPKAPGVTPYGLMYVYFTACAGHFKLVPPTSPNALPFGCADADGKDLGPDDFVPGYASIYVYDNLRNANPVVNDFSFRATSFKDSPSAADSDVPHVARCTNADRASCPSFDIKANIDRASAETDPLAKDADGNPLQEQLWVAYYATGGDFTASLRLVNDSSKGWNDDNATKFRAPAAPGPVRIFAVVHDNRGGVAWAQGKVVID
jgi:hypothetical protein